MMHFRAERNVTDQNVELEVGSQTWDQTSEWKPDHAEAFEKRDLVSIIFEI